jgi:hypothetical protein
LQIPEKVGTLSPRLGMAPPPPPPETWGLDPLFWANVKVTVWEVVGDPPGLVPAEGTNRSVHFFHGRPTRRYEVMGHVVSLTVRDNKTIFYGKEHKTHRVPRISYPQHKPTACFRVLQHH